MPRPRSELCTFHILLTNIRDATHKPGELHTQAWRASHTSLESFTHKPGELHTHAWRASHTSLESFTHTLPRFHVFPHVLVLTDGMSSVQEPVQPVYYRQGNANGHPCFFVIKSSLLNYNLTLVLSTSSSKPKTWRIRSTDTNTRRWDTLEKKLHHHEVTPRSSRAESFLRS